MYKIEKNIPIPHKQIGKYPFDEMEPDDSFLVEDTQPNAVRAAITTYQKKYPDKKFATRTVENGVRVWRLK